MANEMNVVPIKDAEGNILNFEGLNEDDTILANILLDINGSQVSSPQNVRPGSATLPWWSDRDPATKELVKAGGLEGLLQRLLPGGEAGYYTKYTDEPGYDSDVEEGLEGVYDIAGRDAHDYLTNYREYPYGDEPAKYPGYGHSEVGRKLGKISHVPQEYYAEPGKVSGIKGLLQRFLPGGKTGYKVNPQDIDIKQGLGGFLSGTKQLLSEILLQEGGIPTHRSPDMMKYYESVGKDYFQQRVGTREEEIENLLKKHFKDVEYKK